MELRTFVFTKVATGGKLVIQGKSATEVRKRKNLTTSEWTLEGSDKPEDEPQPEPDSDDAP